MRTQIKVCGMRDADNIRDLIQKNPDFIGLIFYPGSSRFVLDTKAIIELRSQLANIKLVGVFVDEDESTILKLNSLLHFDLVQLHGSESPEFCNMLRLKNIQIIKAFGISDKSSFNQIESYQGKIDYALFDTKSKKHGGTGKKFNWSLIDNYTGNTPFFLSGGISPDEIPEINHPQYFGIDINSKFEISPAIKNIKLVSEFIKRIRK